MSLIKKLRVEEPDGKLGEALQFGIEAINVNMANGKNLEVEMNNKADKSAVEALASGSPKGVYATVSALTSANPATGVYIVTSDGHIYSWTKNGSKADDLGVYQATGISENDPIISKIINSKIYGDKIYDSVKLNESYNKGETLQEFFNSSSDNYTTNSRLTNLGELYSQEGYGVTDFIECKGNILHLNNLLDNSSWSNAVFYDANKNYVARGQNFNFNSENNLSLASSYKFVRIVFKMSMGLIASMYADLIIDKYYIPWLKIVDCIIVDKNGRGDYTEIQDAIDNCNDSANSPKTILVMPGVYSRFDLGNNSQLRHVSLIGFNKALCIIKDDSGDYYTPPANIRNEGIIKDLTFIATHENNPSLSGLSSYSYAVHMDFGSQNILFENCRFISYQQAAVGIGVWDTNPINDITEGITLKKCEFIRRGKEGATGNGALIVHNTYASNHSWDNLIPQNFRMEDCYLEVENETYVANIAKSVNQERYDFSFKGCTFHNRNGQAIVNKSIIINDKSHANNVSVLNYGI